MISAIFRILRKNVLQCILLLLVSSSSAFGGPIPSRIVLMWQVHHNVTDDELKFLNTLGINTIQSFQFSTWSDEQIQSYLNKAASHGMGVLGYIGKLMKYDSTTGKYVHTQEAKIFVEKWKSHGAIMGWHLMDEPKEDKILKKNQEDLYKHIKNIDRDHPIMISTNVASTKEFDMYFTENAFDILDLHRYVNPNIAKAQVEEVENFFKWRKKTYPVIATFRAWNGSEFKVRRKDMVENSLMEQYNFYVKKMGINNFGFYGWALSPNRGIKDDPMIHDQFVSLMKKIKP